MRYFLLVAIPAWVGISLVGADLLDILATSTVGRPTAQLIPFIGLGLLVSSLQQVYTIVMQLTERTSALAATKLIIAFFYIVLVFYAVPRWGLLGGAIVTAIGYVLDLSSSALLAARHGRIFPDLGNIVKQGIAAALMIPAVLLISAPGIPGILLKVMMGLAVYLVSLILIGGIGRRELQFLKSIVTRHESRA
jgi:O-antigen/teichoic acid export membrane protein